MKPRLFAAFTLLTSLSLAAPAQAENLEHTQQLLSTRQCQNCDLTRAGFVYGNLSGADLSGSDLREANLTRADLSNANLRGADLRQAVLHSANLAGADLSGANLAGADLRDASFEGVNLTGANLEGANLMGAVGMPEGAITAEDYYRWGLLEDQQGDFRGAIDYYNQALTLKPDFAHALLARGAARLSMHDTNGALQDAERAEQYYLAQGNGSGHQLSVQFAAGIRQYQEAQAEASERRGRGGGGNLVGFLSGLANMAIRFLPLFLVP